MGYGLAGKADVACGARWYDALTGRWTQQDTLDAPLNPANANRYAFAANDPINNSDPTGLLVGELGFTACLFACISLGLAQDDVTGAYAVTGGFGIGSPGVAGNVKISPGEVSTSAGPEGSCGLGPLTVSMGTTGGSGGLSTGLSSGFCTVQWAANLRL